MKQCFFSLFIFLFSISFLFAQKIEDYNLHFSKMGKEPSNIHVRNTFTLDFQDKDSVSLRFGGAPEFSVENLEVNDSAFRYTYRREQKEMVLYRENDRKVFVQMEYGYTNLASFFIYGEGKAELWEPSYGEYFYPYIPNTYMDVSLTVEVPDSLLFLCSYPLEPTGKRMDSLSYQGRMQSLLSQSIVLAFFQKDAYIDTVAYVPDRVDVYQISDMRCGQERYAELLDLTQASIAYFSEVYGEEYLSEARNIRTFPSYLFHDGKGFSNRYNIGFISASQEKFSTYPDIYPLVHEIGHRWLGEWTLLIDDGEPGAYFIKESLNEFMTLLFIRHYYGSQSYKVQLDRCWSEYAKIKGTTQDQPLVDMVENNNNIIVYRKGPLVLDRIANEMGYDQLVDVISRFYRKYAGQYPLRYTDFIDMVNESKAGAGDRLHQLLSSILID